MKETEFMNINFVNLQAKTKNPCSSQALQTTDYILNIKQIKFKWEKKQRTRVACLDGLPGPGVLYK